MSVNYGRYVIKTEKRGDAWRARALRGKAVATQILQGATEQDVILKVKSQLDADIAADRRERAPDGYPAAARVLDALNAVRKTKARIDMLAAHRNAPDHVMTATEIARAGGYKTYSAANSQYGTLARLVAEEMEYDPPKRPDGTSMWTYALAVAAEKSVSAEDDGQFRWRMRPEVIAALG